MSCNCNPCGEDAANTAANETIASQISNFTEAFFGEVEKTEINGVVSWVLPCSLETGLTNNPRLPGEGLSCYFKRLFEEGILGLTGPPGEDGNTGSAGFNAFTVVTASFTQPTLAMPNVSISTFYNPSISDGMYIFIQTSGWFSVNANDPSGTLNLTLAKALPGAPATIPAGKLVVPSGFPGESIVGPAGPQGATGAQGPAGSTFTTQNNYYQTNVGTDWQIPLAFTAVDFTTSQPQVTLAQAGVYQIIANVQVRANAPIMVGDGISLKLRDNTSAIDVPGSERQRRGLNTISIEQLVLSVRYETVANNSTVQLFGRMDTANSAAVMANFTSLMAVRLA